MADGVERRETEDALFARLRDPNTDEASRRAIRSELVEMHTPLVRHIARRYADRGEPFDDVVQAGNIGLINAVDRFEPDRGLAFSTYAVPTIIGAIRRYFRDSTWSVKVPRRLQEMRGRIDSSSDRLTQEFGRAPTIAEIAAHAGVDAQDVLDSLELGRVRESTPIDATATGETPLADRLGVDDASLAGVEDEETVRRLLNTLPARERAIVVMRFFDGMSQSQIAEHVGLSQMHVSRLLAQSLTRLRSEVLT
ncbi:MAG: SigB/SigF/SigG family RNA polymerase sigma factor [Candidatus Nanopelagicales bacterium]